MCPLGDVSFEGCQEERCPGSEAMLGTYSKEQYGLKWVGEMDCAFYKVSLGKN